MDKVELGIKKCVFGSMKNDEELDRILFDSFNLFYKTARTIVLRGCTFGDKPLSDAMMDEIVTALMLKVIRWTVNDSYYYDESDSDYEMAADHKFFVDTQAGEYGIDLKK